MADAQAAVSIEEVQVASAPEKKKSSRCVWCCKCYCVCCCCCLALLGLAVIIVLNTVLQVESADPPAPAAPTAELELGVSYTGADPGADTSFKADLVRDLLGELGGSDDDGSIAQSLVFEQGRRLAAPGEARGLSTEWTATLQLTGDLAAEASVTFTSVDFDPSDVPNLLSVSVSSSWTVLATAHLLKDLDFVCTTAYRKVMEDNRAKIIENGVGSADVTGASTGINEDGWVWVSFRRENWRYSPTALSCEALRVWAKGLQEAKGGDMGDCTLNKAEDGVQVLVGTGRGGDECYFADLRQTLLPIQIGATCFPDAFCQDSEGPRDAACDDLEFPGCSKCATPTVQQQKYTSCLPF